MADLAEEVEHQLRVRVRRSRTRRRSRRTSSATGTRSRTTRRWRRLQPIAVGEAVMFDFGAVWAGFCSDFGRTIVAGEHAEYERVYDVMLAAQEAGRAAAVGALASEVNAAAAHRSRGRPRRVLPPPDGPPHRSRRPRAAVHLGGGRDAARGGNDVHRRAVDPVDAHFAVRIEDVVVCAEGGGRALNELSGAAVIRHTAERRRSPTRKRGRRPPRRRHCGTGRQKKRRGGSGLPVRFVASSCHDELTRETRARFGLVHERADLGVAHGGLCTRRRRTPWAATPHRDCRT